MKIHRILKILVAPLAIALVSLIPACANQTPKQQFQIEHASTGKARVYIYRNSKIARVRDVSIQVDGKQIAILGNREYVSLLLAEGPHQLKTKWAIDVSIPDITYSISATSESITFLHLDISQENRGVKITGNAAAPLMPDIKFSSQFLPEDQAQAYEAISCCLRASAQ